ncbi:DUF3826 domain-containing protein [Sphingobacterium bovistauri]|uniref:DUF3826 domain-containing protein n=1 Tax=Sphingobacterium bovistauri TaxID=2781959 RepID=A0ABS7Z3W5_9SPHI|nr:DUF3826 domain-containing protein [Sphingobacterium bovistauri]MCA5004698.1 DUF3826 domain-containing protein [Sphingobacterium bovistauri]
MKRIILLISLLISSHLVFSQNQREEYLEVLKTRSQKILNTSELENHSSVNVLLKEMIDYYDKINSNAEGLKKELDNLKASGNNQVDQIKSIEGKYQQHAFDIYNAFVSTISLHIDKRQVESIVDGITYGILPRTYNAYLAMIPNLKDGQKKIILDMLKEARDLAIIGSDSKQRHAAFGKYKGRINNYLSKEGYDLKKEGEKWKERINKDS